MDSLDKFLFILGALAITSYFYVDYLIVCAIIGAMMILGGIISRDFKAMTMGALSILPYLNHDYKAVAILLGMLLIVGALGSHIKPKEIKTDAPDSKEYIERIVYSNKVSLDIFIQDNKKFCVIESIADEDFKTMDEIVDHYNSISKALDKVQAMILVEPNTTYIWKVKA